LLKKIELPGSDICFDSRQEEKDVSGDSSVDSIAPWLNNASRVVRE
jgi:hypothetical protein